MCIILFAYKTHPRYELILAANRDEYYVRPTARAAFWKDAPDILAGCDLERRGTWLGVTRRGSFAAVTNFREPASLKKDAPSRGLLVSDFLLAQETAADYLSRTATFSTNFNGFNLIAGDRDGVYYHSNRDEGVRALSPGVYGLSNHLLDTSWPKVENGKRALSGIIRQRGEIDPEAVFEILADHMQADDAMLPQTGISLEYERALSPIFIATPAYGTRSSTLMMIDLKGIVTFIERTFEPRECETDAIFRFQSKASVLSSRS